MAGDINEIVRELLTHALQSVGGDSDGKAEAPSSNGSGGGSALKGIAAGAGAAALAPIAFRKLRGGLGGDGLADLLRSPRASLEGAVSKVGDRVTSGAKDKAQEAMGQAGGPGGIVKDAVKGMLPGGGGGGGGGAGGKQDTEGVGKGRRMPIQQSVDVALPIETVYNQWTQFEEWPKFMHRVTRASQEDPCKVNFAVKIWGKTKEFTAEIETQRPNDRIKWKTSEGINHTGVVTFRELTENLTRVALSFDVAPGSLIEKYARGTRYVKRAARADLHRFAAFIEMLEKETGAWRGVIEDGELVEDHDPSYDEEREYGSADELVHGRGSDEEEEEESDEEDEHEDSDDEEGEPQGRSGGQPPSRSQRGGQARRRSGNEGSRGSSQSQPASSRSSGGSSSGGRSSSGGSSSRGRSSSGNGRSSRSGGERSSSGGRGRSSGGSTSGRSSSSSSSGSSGTGSRSSGTSRGESSSRSSGSRSSAGNSSSGRTGSRGRSQSSRSAPKTQGRSRGASSQRA